MLTNQFNQMRTMPLAQLLKQPKRVLLAFAKQYLALTNTQLQLIKAKKEAHHE